MSSYFPFGVSSTTVPLNVSYSLATTTASVAKDITVLAQTVISASSVQISPASGQPGTNKTAGDCTGTAPTGDQGVQGPRGDKGANYNYCPTGTIECTQLHISLSAAWSSSVSAPKGVNYYRPSGSQFYLVCIESAGYFASSITCPDYLPTSSNYITPTIP